MTRKALIMVGAAMAALLALSAVQAQGPRPRVDVSTTIDTATETGASGSIVVCNVSEDPISGDPIDVTIATVDDNLSYLLQKQARGSWE